MGANMTVSGLGSLDAKIKALALKKAREQNKGLRAGAEILAQSMREHVNVSNNDHKHIRDDIQISNVKTDDFGSKHIDIGPGKETGWRAKFIENGTSKMSPHPFMGPAVAEDGERATQAMKDAVKGP